MKKVRKKQAAAPKPMAPPAVSVDHVPQSLEEAETLFAKIMEDTRRGDVELVSETDKIARYLSRADRLIRLSKARAEKHHARGTKKAEALRLYVEAHKDELLADDERSLKLRTGLVRWYTASKPKAEIPDEKAFIAEATRRGLRRKFVRLVPRANKEAFSAPENRELAEAFTTGTVVVLSRLELIFEHLKTQLHYTFTDDPPSWEVVPAKPEKE